jgi:hypothetical protein
VEIAKVIETMISALRTDSALTALTWQPAIYKNMSRKDIIIPGIFWSVVSATPTENEWRIVVQWDVWGATADQQFQIEARLLAVMHKDVAIDFGNNVILWSRCINRHDDLDDEQGTYHSAMEFEYRPIREVRYSGP